MKNEKTEFKKARERYEEHFGEGYKINVWCDRRSDEEHIRAIEQAIKDNQPIKFPEFKVPPYITL